MLASLVLHVLVLSALPFLAEAKRQIPARLTARMEAPKPSGPVLSKAAPSAEPVARRPAALGAAPRAKAAPQQAVLPFSVPAAIPGVESPPQAGESASAIAATHATQPQVTPQVPAASGPDAGTVARFRLELMDLARRYKNYPRVAQDNNWEGRVELRVAIGENGAIASLSVKKGTGRAVLDEEAQAMIRSAQSRALIPPGLRGKAFSLEIPVDFFLKDEEK